MHILYMCVYIYYKELAYMIMEADKSQDMHSASWRPRKANGILLVWKLAGWRPMRNLCFYLSQKAGKSQCPSSKTRRQGKFPLSWGMVDLFVLGRQLIKAHLLLGRTNLHVNLMLKIFSQQHFYLVSNAWPNIWAPCGSVKLKIKINCYTHQRNQEIVRKDKSVRS